MAVLESAVEANPNNQWCWCIAAGIAHLHCGSLDEALAYFHRADPARARTTRGAHLA